MNHEELTKFAQGVWERNWKNAKKFFDSKGNLKTRSGLKTKWYNEFFKDLDKFGTDVLKITSEDLGL